MMHWRTAMTGGRWLLALTLALSLAGCITVNTPLSGGGDDSLHESVIRGTGAAKIVWLPIDGFISSHPSSQALGLVQRESTLTRIERALNKAGDDPDVKAVVLAIDSPGGTVAASDAIYHRIKTFEAETGIPVIAHLDGVAASGGYYVAMSANRLIAAPTTITGSIGVIIANVNAAGLMDKIGLTDTSVTSGAHKAILSPLRPPAPDDRAIVQQVVDGLYQRFVAVVQANRPNLDQDRLATITDGRIFTARAAQQLGLVDTIGYRDDAIDAARAAAQLPSARVVRYYQGATPPRTLSAHAGAAGLGGASASSTPGVDALSALLAARSGMDGTTPLYLWRGAARY
ncbi:signal peptide peptidase SppA [Salinisphaera sp. Q1T1-3]|uniref:signal peptide peptidase SppA n=1 Tax=Salinisphaera sp. Q1T1-3 TaxID=2321229 RepID=UPI000E70CFDE|nr:signal peptide peptidase SppA [Salinisphaera sp. Q1T1-3]RJS92898.1 signal peptide peptidase SppA [Salinisphaera sp. Q1T1-3]